MRGSVLDRAGADSDAVEIEMVAGKVVEGGGHGLERILHTEPVIWFARSSRRGKRRKGKKNGKEITKVQEEA